jgi:vitamin B12 transporter
MQRKLNRVKTLPVFIAGLCCYCFAFAQTDTVKKLKEVKVNTSPIPKVQSITPVQSVSANVFEQYSAFDVADAVRNFSGMNIKDYGGIGGLKTVSVRSFGADHLGVLFDGVVVNDAQNGQIDLSKFNLNNVQEITLYNGQSPDICAPARSFSYASLLSIQTVRPNLTALKLYQIILGTKAGSFGLINPYLQWQQRINQQWSFIVNTYLENANGRYKYKVPGEGNDTTYTRTNAGINAQQADGALYWTKSDSNKFNLHVNYYNSDRGLPGAVVFYNPSSNQHLWNQNTFVQSGYERLWHNSLHLLINTKISREYTRYRDPDYLNNSGGLDERYTQREFYQSAALDYHLFSNWEVAYAVDFSVTGLDANLYNYAYPTRYTLLNVLASNLVLGKWRFQGSLLNTYVDEQVKSGKAEPSKDAFSPTIMATFFPLNNSDLQLRAFYKDIFRNPTLDEQYYFTVNGARDIKPEYAKQYDLGLAYRKGLNSFLEYVTFTADGYYNNVTNKIVALPSQNIAIASIINLGKVNIEGVEIGVKTQTRQVNGWRGSLSVNYTYQNSVDSATNMQIPYTPHSSLALNAGVDYHHAGLYYNQVVSSSRYYLEDINSQIGGYSEGDLSFIYKFSISSESAIFSAHVNNLFNQPYQIVRSFPMPGRSYLFSIQITI